MELPRVSVLGSSTARWSAWRKHLLAIGVLLGVAGNHALWSYGQNRKQAAAEERLRVTVDLDNGLELPASAYMARDRARSEAHTQEARARAQSIESGVGHTGCHL